LPFRPNEGLAGWVISNRQAALISDVLLDERWLQLPGVISQHRSAIGVPLMVGDEALGALLLFHRKTAHFSADHLDLVQAAANQVALTVKNMDLYSLIRQQAEDLGVLLRIQQVETSRLRAILEAVAEGILVTSADGKISLFNASAERILKLSRGEVADHSLEHFSGLFGKAARAWMEMIQQWSSGRVVERSGETYAEQITLEGGRVVSVHLAPVFLRNEFLGTVSIFHDITHQVEVDRLKSEFVATVSHELRTPLTSIKGYAEVLLMEAAGKLNEQQQHFLQIIKDNVERLTVLLND
jgi:PAS domain S-box-containing protein